MCVCDDESFEFDWKDILFLYIAVVDYNCNDILNIEDESVSYDCKDIL